jgi:signal transduction histidine kinase
MTEAHAHDSGSGTGNLPIRALVHDLNNLITIIRGNITLSREQLDAAAQAQSNLANAETAAAQLRPLIAQLAALQHPVSPLSCSEVEPLLRECMTICLGASSVEASIEVESEVPSVAFERGLLSRIINNLLINAKEALPEGGRVVLRLSQLGPQDPLPESLPSGNYVSIEVNDNGPGITPEKQRRIFEPNYSEKIWGQGLGLASSRALVEQGGGTLTVDSEADQGANFRIILPAAADGA